MNYKLNEKKALSKKVEATHRPLNVEIVLKRGTLVMIFTPAAYEIYKYEIFKYYEQHPQKTFTIHKKTSETKRGIKWSQRNRYQLRIEMVIKVSTLELICSTPKVKWM